MKIFRMIFAELLWSSLFISGLLAAIVALLRFARYLESAAAGQIAVSALLPTLLWRLPEFLSLLLPFGMLVGTFFLLERMRSEGELAILGNCGIGPIRILFYCQAAALTVLGLSVFLNLYLAPLGALRVEQLLRAPGAVEQLRTLAPGRFVRGGDLALYADSVGHGEGRTQLQGVFLAVLEEGRALPAVTVAREGEIIAHAERGLSLHFSAGQSYRPLGEEFAIDRFGALEYPLALPAARSAAAAASGLRISCSPCYWQLGLALIAPLGVLFAFGLYMPLPGRTPRFTPILVFGALSGLLYLYVFHTLRDLAILDRIPLLPLYMHLPVLIVLLSLLLLRLPRHRPSPGKN